MYGEFGYYFGGMAWVLGVLCRYLVNNMNGRVKNVFWKFENRDFLKKMPIERGVLRMCQNRPKIEKQKQPIRTISHTVWPPRS